MFRLPAIFLHKMFAMFSPLGCCSGFALTGPCTSTTWTTEMWEQYIWKKVHKVVFLWLYLLLTSTDVTHVGLKEVRSDLLITFVKIIAPKHTSSSSNEKATREVRAWFLYEELSELPSDVWEKGSNPFENCTTLFRCVQEIDREPLCPT